MSLTKITQVTEKFGISSRTLRYYEQVGLLQSQRPPFEKYRFYDNENIFRLKEILLLRKMQVSIKDILQIYENQDMETLVQSFVKRIHEIDDEIYTLSQLKTYVNDFLKSITAYGITEISALPLLYEKIEPELLSTPKSDLSTQTLGTLSEKLAKPLSIDIVSLPMMLVVTSVKVKDGASDINGFWDWLFANQISLGKPGSRTLFEYQHSEEIIFMQKIDKPLHDCPFICNEFLGGLFAVCSAFSDEDLSHLQSRMFQSFDDNPDFKVDFQHNGNLRHDVLIESVFSIDSTRDRVNIYLPVKERKPDFSDYTGFNELEDITLEQIEKDNPSLCEYEVDFHQIKPVYSPHYQVLENGEAEFIPWIAQRKLDTTIAVKLPFRVDMEFLVEEKSETYLWGTTEGSLWFSHANCTYALNTENYKDKSLKKHGLYFQQPILGNEFLYPNRGEIPFNQYNRLTWIVGEKHFSVILNGKIHFCGVNFPYMTMNLHLQSPHTVIIGSDGQGKKLFRSIKISQLKTTPKIIMKQGGLSINRKQSNNMLPNLRQIVHPEYGENYWFNGCAAYLMDCLGEKDFDYWFFAGLTGENFTQIYSKNYFRGAGVVDYLLSEKDKHPFIEQIFEKCGYTGTFVPLAQVRSSPQQYVQTLMTYIDKGIPIIINDYGNNPHDRFSWGVIVGYEDYGKKLFYMGADAKEPDSISIEDLLPTESIEDTTHCHGWFFIGEKQKHVILSEIYRSRILSLPELLLLENENYCFGVKAFLAWADSIEQGIFEHVNEQNFNSWDMYTVYVCSLATNSGGCKSFLEKALELNPDMTFINSIIALYEKTRLYWNDDNQTDLEALGGGFNVTLNALKDKTQRTKIAHKLRAFSDCIADVVLLSELHTTLEVGASWVKKTNVF
jgi:DNA-binding transcriptional MerR regulator